MVGQYIELHLGNDQNYTKAELNQKYLKILLPGSDIHTAFFVFLHLDQNQILDQDISGSSANAHTLHYNLFLTCNPMCVGKTLNFSHSISQPTRFHPIIPLLFSTLSSTIISFGIHLSYAVNVESIHLEPMVESR